MCGHNLLSNRLVPYIFLSAVGLLAWPPASAAQADLRHQIDALTAATSLDRPGIQPWHMELSFELFDQKGNSQETGTIEEWWADPDHARVVITSPSFNQALPGDDPAVRSREAYLIHLLLEEVVHPAPHIPDPDAFLSTVAPQVFGKATLSCTTLARKDGDGVPESEYCLDPSTGELRLVFEDDIRSDALNEISTAMNSQIAMTHTIAYLGHTAIRGRVDLVEGFDPDHSNLQLGALKSSIDHTVKPPQLLTPIQPVYPERARLSGQSGMVVLNMRILTSGKHGQIDTIASSGPGFTQAAVDAVRRWTFTPMKRDKVAEECGSVIEIIFLPPDKKRDLAHVSIFQKTDP